MPKLPFNVDAYTARLIGRENVSKLNGAVLELVKNTYDADATVCVLYFDKKNNQLCISDNGCGMTKEIIINNWMTIGRSTKKTAFISENGRVQTGAKGIGRFALDRIADSCEMLTITKSERNLWNVDWSSFSDYSNITDVTANLDDTDLPVEQFLDKFQNSNAKDLVINSISKSGTGTIFKLSLLRDNWNNDIISSIKNNLTTLIPFELRTAFTIYFFDESSTAAEAEVLHDANAFSYDYKIEFDVNENGEAKIEIWREEFDFKNDFNKVMDEAKFSKEDRAYFSGTPIEIKEAFYNFIPDRNERHLNTIGPFQGVLYFAKLSVSKVDSLKFFYKDISDRKDFRDTFGGIRIYRDNFRVRPYGEPKMSSYDWLLLSGRKNRSPAAITHPTGAWRVNADQILGSLFISRLNTTLPDQANREGIVETKEFGLLKQFIISVIQLFERDRQYVFRKLSEYYDLAHATEKIQEEINRKAEQEKQIEYEKPADVSVPQLIEVSKAKVLIDQKNEIIRDLEDENRLLRVLATTGIVTNTYVHEFKGLTHALNMKIILAKEALELDQDSQSALGFILQANAIRESFNSWFMVTIESVKKDKRSQKKVELIEFTEKLLSAWNNILAGKNITISFSSPNQEIAFKCFPYEVEAIFSNLIANSISSFESNPVPGDQIINIELVDHDGFVSVNYSDSGVGLSEMYKKDPNIILEPFESDKRDSFGETIGTGMGMWIINRTVSEYNGTIDLSRNKIETSGFWISIMLRRK